VSWILDTGALEALAKGSLYMGALLRSARGTNSVLLVPTAAFSEAWAGASKDDRYRLEFLLLEKATRPAPMTIGEARAVGELLARTGTADLIDAHVVCLATLNRWAVVTSAEDAKALRRLHPELQVEILPQ